MAELNEAVSDPVADCHELSVPSVDALAARPGVDVRGGIRFKKFSEHF